MTSPALVRIHRWVALSLGAFVALIALSGTALVFREELTPVFTPAVRVAPTPIPPGAYQRVLDSARKLEPSARGFDVAMPQRPDRAADVVVRRKGAADRHLHVDPHDGAVVADGDRQWLPFPFLYRLHKYLLAGPAGETLVGLVGLALLFLGASGVVLWWPRRWASAWRVRWSGGRLAVSFDLHRVLGATFALFLLVNAAIGFLMAFDDVSVPVVNRLAGSAGPPPVPRATSDALVASRPLDEIVAAAEQAFPGGVVRRVTVRGGEAPVVVRKRLASENETSGMNRVYVDAATATVLHVRIQEALPAGSAMFEWLYPLHTGTLFGTPYRALLALAGLVPLLSLVTGVVLWRLRARSRQKMSSTGPAR